RHQDLGTGRPSGARRRRRRRRLSPRPAPRAQAEPRQQCKARLHRRRPRRCAGIGPRRARRAEELVNSAELRYVLKGDRALWTASYGSCEGVASSRVERSADMVGSVTARIQQMSGGSMFRRAARKGKRRLIGATLAATAIALTAPIAAFAEVTSGPPIRIG